MKIRPAEAEMYHTDRPHGAKSRSLQFCEFP